LTPSDLSRPVKDYRLKPFVVGKETVGWLGIKAGAPHGNPLDVEFLKNQSITFYSTAGIAAALATLVAFVLSRHLSAPMRELTKGTRALASRRFEARIAVRSSDEFGQLASDFNGMAQALQRYERMRRQWIADISHELRTPLSILQGEIEAMQDRVREVNREALDSLHFEVLHVGRIVHDLHDLSMIESGGVGAELAAVKPLKILDETLRSFRPRFEKENIRVEVEESCASEVAIMANADRLRQLFSNLFENALRYMHAPGVVRVSGQAADGRLVIRIEDSGPGAPEESLDRLFDRLYRVDGARSRAHGGSGLGLAICKSIVECFSGRIEASNAPSGGLEITMVFPLPSS
jgi:two-component system sensor histidine kinase BaeS